MLVLKTFSALALGLALSTTAGHALSLQQGAQPAEFPPASYTGDLYVDSRGCMYIRAGFSGSVTWVPRVSRSREVVCGASPSLNGASAQTTMASAPAVAAPVQLTIPTTAPAAAVAAAPIIRTPVAAAAPVAVASYVAPSAATTNTAITRSVSLTCPAGGSNGNVRASGVTVPLRCDAGQTGSITYIVAHGNGTRTRVTVNPAAPVAAPVQIATTAPSNGLTICTNRSVVGGQYTNSGEAVRCGPQTVAPVPGLSTGGTTTYGSSVYSNPVTAAPVVIPAGYAAAWTDGRLNPNRGPRTAMGTAQMNQVWTQTVPRRLVEVPVVTTARARAPAAPVTQAVTGKRYVQVATFGVAANAQATVRRLQGMGLRVSTSNVTRSGKTYRIVLAGPFTQQAALRSALSQVRGAGFGDAYLR